MLYYIIHYIISYHIMLWRCYNICRHQRPVGAPRAAASPSHGGRVGGSGGGAAEVGERGSAPEGGRHSTIFVDPQWKLCSSSAHLRSGSLMVWQPTSKSDRSRIPRSTSHFSDEVRRCSASLGAAAPACGDYIIIIIIIIIMLYMILYHVASYTMLYYAILYCTVLFRTVLYCSVLHYTILYYTILYYTIL